MQNRCRHLEDSKLCASAIVFSPLPDDETLGCGDTIIRKRKLGAEVSIIVMTDGRKSHPGLISGDELRSLRRSEALEAGRMLGVTDDDVIFL